MDRWSTEVQHSDAVVCLQAAELERGKLARARGLARGCDDVGERWGYTTVMRR